MIKKISLAVCLTALIVIIYSAGTALAAKVTVVVSGGSLSLTPSADSSLTAAVLDGNDTSTTGSLGQLTVTDPRGTGAGWTVDASSTDFVEVSESSKTIPVSGFTVTTATIDSAVGNGGINVGTGPLDTSLRLLDSPGPGGRGMYKVTPSVKLLIPAQTYAGTYSATVTESLLSY